MSVESENIAAFWRGQEGEPERSEAQAERLIAAQQDAEDYPKPLDFRRPLTMDAVIAAMKPFLPKQPDE